MAKIDADPERKGLEHARRVCRSWPDGRAVREWAELLEKSWHQIRSLLLDPGERGRRLRQSSPFCGVLTPHERWEIYREAQ